MKLKSGYMKKIDLYYRRRFIMNHENEVNKTFFTFLARRQEDRGLRDELSEFTFGFWGLVCSNEKVEGMLTNSERTEGRGKCHFWRSLTEKGTLREQLLHDT